MSNGCGYGRAYWFFAPACYWLWHYESAARKGAPEAVARDGATGAAPPVNFHAKTQRRSPPLTLQAPQLHLDTEVAGMVSLPPAA
jgi:hypothetical protein